MGEESVKGANMGVILIIFAAILALGLIIFMLARNMANEGLTNVSERLEAASNSEFSDYDQKVIVGQRIQSALNSFKGKRVAILIATQGLTDKVAVEYPSNASGAWTAFTQGTTSGTKSPAAGNTDLGSQTSGPLSQDAKSDTGATQVLMSTAVVNGHETMRFAFGAVPGRNNDNSVNRSDENRGPLPASSSGRKNDKWLTFIQYNALLEPTTATGVVTAGDGHSVIWWNDDHYVFSGSFRTSDGKVMFDLVYTNCSTAGRTEMIPTAARFNANLLKDENGVILGIVLQQIGS